MKSKYQRIILERSLRSIYSLGFLYFKQVKKCCVKCLQNQSCCNLYLFSGSLSICSFSNLFFLVFYLVLPQWSQVYGLEYLAILERSLTFQASLDRSVVLGVFKEEARRTKSADWFMFKMIWTNLEWTSLIKLSELEALHEGMTPRTRSLEIVDGADVEDIGEYWG